MIRAFAFGTGIAILLNAAWVTAMLYLVAEHPQLAHGVRTTMVPMSWTIMVAGVILGSALLWPLRSASSPNPTHGVKP